MLANELSFGGSLPQTFSTIPRKNFTDRPYNKPGQVGYFKVVPRGYKCENMYPVILQVPVYIYVTSTGYTYWWNLDNTKWIHLSPAVPSTSRTGFIVVQLYSLNIPSPKRLRLDSLQQNYL